MFRSKYKELRTLLLAEFPQLFIDLWRGQVERDTEEHAYPRPAVFVEFGTFTNEQCKTDVPDGDFEVLLHVVVDTYRDTASTSPEEENALDDIFKLLDEITEVIAANYNLLTVRPDSNPSSICEHIITFDL
jgi:hypothetical protein